MDTPLRAVNVITMFVRDLEPAKAFYRDVFSLEMAFEDANSAVFRFENLMINLLVVSAAPELIAPAAVAAEGAGASYQLTITVTDVDAVSAQLVTRGAALLNGPIDRAWGVRTAALADPDGHVWELAQDLS